jgi:hypothetical protein
MATNEILEEMWRIKDQLWREAGGDLDAFCDQLNDWSEKNPFPGRVLRTPEEIRRFVKGDAPQPMSIQEEPPAYGGGEEKQV